MNQRSLLNRLANDISDELMLEDDLVIREVRNADDLIDARRRLLAIRRDVNAALQIVRAADSKWRRGRDSNPGYRY